MAKSKFKVGDLVKWNDPAIHDYPKNEQTAILNRIFSIWEIDGDIIRIAEVDGNTEAEVYACELTLIKN